MKTLKDLFLEELEDMYDAEQRLVKALPQMAKAATHEELADAFRSHLKETEGHVKQLEQVFKSIDEKPRRKKCEAITGLLEEGEEISAENKGHPTINAALISAAQKVEHYEIASYGCLRTWAELLENDKATELLEDILAQEKQADETLTIIAVKACNQSAQDGDAEPVTADRSH
jgi:ferritin-like metal-binding protein YciE